MTVIKSYVSNFTVRLGPIAAVGQLKPVRLPESQDTERNAKTSYCTPTGGLVHQQYVDDDGTVWDKEDLTRAVVSKEDDVAVVDLAALEESRKSVLPKDILDLTVHPAGTLSALYPDKANGYLWVPDAKEQKNVDFYDTIRAAVKHSDKVLLGVCNVAGRSEGLYTLTLWRGWIALVKMLYPASLHDHSVREGDLPVATRKAVLGIVDDLVTEFDPSTYRSAVAARIREVTEAAAAPGTKPKKITHKAEVPAAHDLLATLQAMGDLVKSDA